MATGTTAPAATPTVKHNRVRTVLEMIKFEHSVFALPFALTGALLARAGDASRLADAGGNCCGSWWRWWRRVRAAMTINRIVDLRYDRENPRTKHSARWRPGLLSVSFAWMFTLIAVAVFFVAAWQLNSLALKLAPVALAILFFYSYTKRFTTWSHLVSGICAGHFARGRVDRHHRRFRFAHADSLRGGHAVGGRIRRALRLPGPGVRPTRGTFFHSASDSEWRMRWLIARAMHVGVIAAAGVAGGQFRAAVAGVGGHRGRRGAAGLRTFAG